MNDLLIQDHLLFPQILWQLPQNIYKRQRGKILILAGSQGMTGAAILTCEAAFRSGAGIVVLGFPDKLRDIYKKILPEAMTLPLPATKSGSLSLKGYEEIIKKSEDFDVVALGPGLSDNPETAQLIWELIFNLPKPLILDADGINALSLGLKIIREKENLKALFDYLKKRKLPTIITPHPGEALRLYKVINPSKRKLKPEDIDKHRLKVSREMADFTGFITILKGANTVIAEPQGRLVVNQTGNPGMATAGSGDVLTGIIATFLAQNLKQIFEACATAVYLHGLAGDLASEKIGQRSIIASDLIKYLPEAIKKAEEEISQ